jgi:predicted alpha/beta hydrolase
LAGKVAGTVPSTDASPEPEPELVSITSRDGATSQLRVFRPTASAATVLVMPAMGAAATYYDPFARTLSERGMTVAVGDHRGSGSSSVRARRGVEYGYVDQLSADWPALIEAARALGNGPLALAGHSLGGQLACLYEAEHPGTFTRIALLAACSVEWRGWKGPRRYLLLSQVVIVSALARAIGFFPGERLGFGGRQASRLMHDWSRQARTGRYAPTGASLDYERALREVRTPLLSISVRGDHYAPRSACDGLLVKMPAAQVQRLELEPIWTVRRATDPHFRWAREPEAMVAAVAPFLAF